MSNNERETIRYTRVENTTRQQSNPPGGRQLTTSNGSNDARFSMEDVKRILAVFNQTNRPTFKSINIPVFNGKQSEVAHFLDVLRAVASSKNVSLDDMVHWAVPGYLLGHAQRWFQQNKHKFSSWEIFESEFLKRFDLSPFARSLLLDKVVQNPDESLYDFILRFTEAKGNLDDSYAAWTLFKNVNEESYTNLLYRDLHSGKSFEDIATFVLEHRSCFESRNTMMEAASLLNQKSGKEIKTRLKSATIMAEIIHEVIAQTKEQRPTSEEEDACFINNLYDALESRKNIIGCSNCNKKGHFKSECTDLKQSGSSDSESNKRPAEQPAVGEPFAKKVRPNWVTEEYLDASLAKFAKVTEEYLDASSAKFAKQISDDFQKMLDASFAKLAQQISARVVGGAVELPQTGGPIVYTDGACENNGQDNASGGIGVYWGPHDRRNVSEALLGRQTNNRAEIQAAVRAIGQGKEQGLREMTIRSDSRLLIEGMTNWMNNWRRNGWKNVSGGPVENRADFEDIIAVSDGIRVHWEYVKGHSGDVGNDAADRLAKEGMKKHPN